MLTDFAITKTKADPARELRLADREGLHLAVLPTGKRYWRWDYTFEGRRKQLSFGKYPVVTLARAREKQLEAQRILDAGTDPSHARQRAKVTALEETFAAVANEWLAKEAKTLAPKTVAKKRAALDRYLLPTLGPLQVGKILPADVLPILLAIDRFGKYETAHGVRRMASQVFRHAVITSRATMDPAALLGDALTAVVTTHHPTLLDPPAVGALLTAIDHAEGSPFIMAALQLAPLVFLRPFELRFAEWREIDLDGAMWRIPARRMKPTKDRLDHLVPLATQAVSILRQLKAITGTSPILFHGKDPRQPLSDATLGKVLRRIGYPKEVQSAHGFRTLASTHLREIGFDGDLVELQLSHKIANPVRAAYDKAARVGERVQMMQAWADHLDAMKAGRVVSLTGRVISFPAGAAR